MARPTAGGGGARRGAGGARRLALELPMAGAAVPAILQLPAGAPPAPAALLLHGYSSRKERLADTMGRVLLARGIASLAIDLPMHGEREGAIDEASRRNPIALVRQWRLAQAECTEALRFLAAQPAIDGARLAIVGYSLGAFVGLVAAAREASVRALVLAAGGDLPAATPFASIVRAAADPMRAVRRLAGRPLLMVHGRRDRTVLPEQAERLFAAAREPKTMRWYDAGHWLPEAAMEEAGEWLEGALG